MISGSSGPTILILDCNAIVHRAYHALPPLTTKRGEVVNALYGFLLVFLKAIKDFSPQYVFATFDVPGKTFRHKKFVEYKAKRVRAPETLYQQIPLVQDAMTAFGVPVFAKEGFEADDLIGTLAARIEKTQILPSPKTVIITGDMDTLQLVDKNTSVFTLRRGLGDTVLYDPEEIIKRFGFVPKYLPDYKGLRGDPSDNIPGVRGIGEKIAAELIKNFNKLEDLYRAVGQGGAKAAKVQPRVREKLLTYKEDAFFSRELATIDRNVEVEFSLEQGRWGAFDRKRVEAFLKRFEFSSLLQKIPTPLVRGGGGATKPESASPKGLGVDAGEVVGEIDKLHEEGMLSDVLASLEKKLVPILDRMQRRGIRLDVDRLASLKRKIDGSIKSLEEKIYNLAGATFKINSPQQLSETLFVKMKLSPAGLKKTPGGVVSVAADELLKLKGVHPIVDAVVEYRELTKLKNTYVDALPGLVNPKTGRVHTTFNQFGAATGRLSSFGPNLQNIPIRGEFGREIRRAFVAESGFLFLSADYSQMELRVAASVSGDKKMKQFFKEGKDIHAMTAAQVFNVREEEVTPGMRTLAKTLNFGVLYGMGPQGFAQAAGISLKEAKKFIEEYMRDFSGVAKYIETVKKQARETGYVETRLGRKRQVFEILSSDPRVQRQGERIAVNLPIQGLAADIMKMAMEGVDSVIAPWGDNVRLLLQVHDELLLEVKETIISEVVPVIKREMEAAYALEVPLVAECKAGPSWGDLQKIV